MQIRGDAIWGLRAFLAVLAVLMVVLQGCATSPYTADNKARSDALLDQQLAAVKPASSADAPPRLFILSAALNDQSKAFRGDVDGFSDKLAALQKNAVSIRLSNPVIGQTADLPFATWENLGRAVRQMASAMRPTDKAVVMLTTHGNVNALSIHAGGQPYPDLSGQGLQRLLIPLERFEHGVVLSACFSGSFIPALRHDTRWIMTAASADRPSFGCQFSGTQTYFMQALLGQPLPADKTLAQWYEQAKKTVTERERREKLSPSSDPQFSPAKKLSEGVTIGAALGF